MIRDLFRSREPLSDFVHFHVDSDGRRIICDESACRPAHRRSHLLPPLPR